MYLLTRFRKKVLQLGVVTFKGFVVINKRLQNIRKFCLVSQSRWTQLFTNSSKGSLRWVILLTELCKDSRRARASCRIVSDDSSRCSLLSSSTSCNRRTSFWSFAKDTVSFEVHSKVFLVLTSFILHGCKPRFRQLSSVRLAIAFLLHIILVEYRRRKARFPSN